MLIRSARLYKLCAWCVTSAAGATTRGGWAAPPSPRSSTARATCCRCNEPIHPGDDWHLDHTDARDGYLGVSHASCNLRDGANKTNGKRPPPPPEQPYKWSRRFVNDSTRRNHQLRRRTQPRGLRRQRRMAAARRHSDAAICVSNVLRERAYDARHRRSRNTARSQPALVRSPCAILPLRSGLHASTSITSNPGPHASSTTECISELRIRRPYIAGRRQGEQKT